MPTSYLDDVNYNESNSEWRGRKEVTVFIACRLEISRSQFSQVGAKLFAANAETDSRIEVKRYKVAAW